MKKVNKAFSIAEAFIMLTIVSVALAAAAPMITKQIKHNNLSNVQTNILGREINQAENKINVTNKNIQDIVGTGRTAEQYAQYIASLEARISALEGIDIENLQAQINEKISANDLTNRGYLTRNDMENYVTNQELNSLFPAGTIVAFNMDRCPTGWATLSSRVAGADGAFIRNLGGNARTRGQVQLDAAPNITGSFGSLRDWEYTNVSGAFFRGTARPSYNGYNVVDGFMVDINAQNSSPSYGRDNTTEVRPKNIAFLYCVKN